MSSIFEEFDRLCKPHTAAGLTTPELLREINDRIEGQQLLSARGSSRFSAVRLADLTKLRTALMRATEARAA